VPRFDFECTQCGAVREEFLSGGSDHTVDCHCCGSPTRKLVGGFAFKMPTDFESYDAAEKKMALENKKFLDNNKDKIDSGELVVNVPKLAPRECVPDYLAK
jgi:putative FmdB family regulatory protein